MSEIHVVRTGIPGIFYRRPSPSDPVYVEEGAAVSATDQIGLIEIMKSFHPVLAGVEGVIVRFAVEDAASLDPGQDIAEIDTNA